MHPHLELLRSSLGAAASQRERLDAVLALGTWALSADGRMAELLDCLEQDHAAAACLQDTLAQLFIDADGRAFLAESGIPRGHGVVGEAIERVQARILPRARDDADLGAVAMRLFCQVTVVEHLERLSAGDMARLIAVCCPPERWTDWAQLDDDLSDALRLLASRLAALGLHPEIRSRGSIVSSVTASPFHRAHAAAELLADAIDGASDRAPASAALLSAIAAARDELNLVHRRLEDAGVSVTIVFGMEILQRVLLRLELLAAVAQAKDLMARARAVRQLLVWLCGHALHDRSLVRLARSNLKLLSSKIVERSGHTGEHYIAHDRASYRHIWLAAAGGGLLTVGTAAIKVAISALHHAVHLPPVPTGLLYGLNYAGSFVAMQHLGLMLATKQPAMTAAALASIMREHQGSERAELIVDRAATIVSSQLAAVLANLGMVALGTALFDFAWHALSGQHWMTASEAQAVYTAMSPVDSGTVIFAALTGVLLWASSLAGGWIDNWSTLHRIPEGLAFWRTHIAGWGTNISLGLMLGFTPAIGDAIGIPLDVRHVTLSTGILSLACMGMDTEWFNQGFFLLAASGIAVMFVLNLGISFLLSLFTAARAYDLDSADVIAVLRKLAQRALSHPLQFVLPPKS